MLSGIELLAGGLALGLEEAGFEHIVLNECDKDSCKTLRSNRASWKILEKDIKTVDWNSDISLYKKVPIDLVIIHSILSTSFLIISTSGIFTRRKKH